MVRNFRTLAAVFGELEDPSFSITLGSYDTMLSLGKLGETGGYQRYWLRWDMELEADGLGLIGLARNFGRSQRMGHRMFT